jgi:hypothetical protein
MAAAFVYSQEIQEKRPESANNLALKFSRPEIEIAVFYGFQALKSSKSGSHSSRWVIVQ